MDYNPINYLGLSCQSSGDFYICQDSKTQFLGCCEIDPCGSKGGLCPSSALSPSKFAPLKYNEIKPQSCTSSTKNALWYTCTNGPTFLGCCASNPCNNDGVCPGDDLVGAVLNSDKSDASVFLTTTATVASISTSLTHTTISATTSSTTKRATLVSSPTSSSISGPISSKSSGAPIGGILGSVLGGIAVLGLVALVIFLYRRRWRRIPVAAQPDENATAMSHPPWSPYHDSFRSRSAISPAPVSPLSTVSTHRSHSASLGSMIGLKHLGTNKRWKFHISVDHETVNGHGNGDGGHSPRTPAMELDSSRAYYEMEGSTSDVQPKETAS
ncbi:hypothetical protein F4678DRAFT_440073 [Xylaria arbuscula]|nr:hypothetical protein F4678DRAFT_440073 [Xylaria arbuscula]